MTVAVTKQRGKPRYWFNYPIDFYLIPIWWHCKYTCGNSRVVEEKRLLARLITACVPCEKRRQMEEPAE